MQSAYDGAALVHSRNQALSYMGKSDPPGHAESRHSLRTARTSVSLHTMRLNQKTARSNITSFLSSRRVWSTPTENTRRAEEDSGTNRTTQRDSHKR